MFEQRSVEDRFADNEDDQELRAAIYARTSSHNQEFGYSLDAQVRRSIDQCESFGWKVRFVYRDAAESGKDTDRPMFQRMLSASEKDVFDVVVFWKLDRFSRSLMHAVRLESKLRNHGVSLYSVTEQIDTTSATGRFNFRNIASAAEFERDMIRQRTQMGLNALASELKWPNDSPPLGYRLDSDRRLQIEEESAGVVREIFDLYMEERSMPEVAKILNSRGDRTELDGEWTPRAVGDVLRNEIYKGVYDVADVSKHVPEYQIISEEKFEQVTSIRHRFQSESSSRPSMSNSRKEKAITRMRQMYSDYRDSTG